MGESGGVRSELRSFHLLRVAACLMVMLCHTDGCPYGETGVEFFFVLSGFLLMHSTEARGPAGFWGRRLRRIVPLYWGATLVTAALVVLFPGFFRSYVFRWDYLLKSLLFLPYTHDGADGPLMALGWTLNLEMFFSLLFWTAMKLNHRRRAWIALGLLLGLCLWGRLAALPMPLSFWTRPELLEFAFGILAYLLWQQAKVRGWTPRGGASPVLTAAALLVLALGIVLMERLYRRGVPRALGPGATAALLVLLFAVMDPALSVPEPVKLLARESYGLYLWHPYPVRALDLLFIRLLGGVPLWTAPVNTALSTALLLAAFALGRRLLSLARKR